MAGHMVDRTNEKGEAEVDTFNGIIAKVAVARGIELEVQETTGNILRSFGFPTQKPAHSLLMVTEITGEWTSAMTKKYVPQPFDHRAGRHWDWGQALARELYGLEGMNDAPDDPPEEVLKIMELWFNGGFPEWMEVRGIY